MEGELAPRMRASVRTESVTNVDIIFDEIYIITSPATFLITPCIVHVHRRPTDFIFE